MSEALSIASFPPGYRLINPYARPGSAFSTEAQALTKIATEVLNNFEKSQALFGEKSEAISQLREIANECCEKDWDGYGAYAVDPQAVLVAENFVRALPGDVPLPEFAPEPGGSVSMDWIHSRNRLFSMSVNASSRLAFAWLDGTDKGHGVTYFDGDIVPLRILRSIREIMDCGNAPDRVA